MLPLPLVLVVVGGRLVPEPLVLPRPQVVEPLVELVVRQLDRWQPYPWQLCPWQLCPWLPDLLQLGHLQPDQRQPSLLLGLLLLGLLLLGRRQPCC